MHLALYLIFSHSCYYISRATTLSSDLVRYLLLASYAYLSCAFNFIISHFFLSYPLIQSIITSYAEQNCIGYIMRLHPFLTLLFFNHYLIAIYFFITLSTFLHIHNLHILYCNFHCNHLSLIFHISTSGIRQIFLYFYLLAFYAQSCFISFHFHLHLMHSLYFNYLLLTLAFICLY